MANPPFPTAGFSARRRWGIFFSVLVSIAAVGALVVMLNFLGARYFLRFNWSAGTNPGLSKRTLGLLQTVTNDIKVVIYYDTEAGRTLYTLINSKLGEYQLANKRISIQTVDYVRDPSGARRIQETYRLTSDDDKDQIIFDNNGHFVSVPGKLLWEYGPWEQVVKDGQREMNHDLKAFDGESAFDAALLIVLNPKPFNACSLTGHGEHNLNGQNDDDYGRFHGILAQNDVNITNLILTGAGVVPADCDFLVIAGPKLPLEPGEVDKVRHYLARGGRLFVLFNNAKDESTDPYRTGLEPLLAEYGVEVRWNSILDRDNTAGGVIYASSFNPKHPISSPLQSYLFAVISPRSISASGAGRQDPDPPTVSELAWTGTNSLVIEKGIPLPARGRVPFMAAVEKANAKAGLAEHAPTRIVVVGDSLCLENAVLSKAPDKAANSAFAWLAVNWLLYRPQLMEGIGPQNVSTYRLAMTNSEMNRVRWIFLAAMPGGVLALGAMVWLRRRR